jgi:hypothetical protein
VSVLALGLQNGPGRRASLGWDERNFLSLADLSPGPHHLEVFAVDEYGSHHQGQRVIEVISR